MDNLVGLLNFFDIHAGSITAIFTMSIAIFTMIYVGGTLLMWLEMRKSRQRLDKPNIQISLEPQERWGNLFDLVVENLGNVPVYNLRLQIEPKDSKTMGNRKLGDLNLFKKTIPVFGIGQRLRTLAVYYVDFIHSDQPKKISFIAKYKDNDNKSYVQRYDFDMEIYLGMSASSEKTLKDVVEHIEKLTKEINKISRYYEKEKIMRNFDHRKLGETDKI